MARCRRCGKKVAWGRDICPECQALRFEKAMPGGLGQSVAGSSNTFIRKSTSTKITIVINGKPVQVSSHGEVTPEMLQQLAAEVGLPEEHLRDLLQDVQQQAAQSLGDVSEVASTDDAISFGTSSTTTAQGPLHKVTCPECHRTVPDRKGWCMYCGAELTHTEAPSAGKADETADDVDRKFLEEDVGPQKVEEEREQERLRQSYKDRLSDL